MLPTVCPSCYEQLRVERLKCGNCQTEVSGLYDLPVPARLTPQEQEFIIAFICSSGSLKEMAKYLKLSYPTVRNMLDEIIQKIKNYEQKTEVGL